MSLLDHSKKKKKKNWNIYNDNIMFPATVPTARIYNIYVTYCSVLFNKISYKLFK